MLSPLFRDSEIIDVDLGPIYRAMRWLSRRKFAPGNSTGEVTPMPALNKRRAVALVFVALLSAAPMGWAAQRAATFHDEEATIGQIPQAIRRHQITTVSLVEQSLRRIQAYNGTCVNEPNGILGVIATIPHARQINALSTINLRPATRANWGFEPRKARSLTDLKDDSPNLPDALEVAAAQDRAFGRTGRLAGPLHGVVMAIKDQYDTFDMRTTSGGDADYLNDR